MKTKVRYAIMILFSGLVFSACESILDVNPEQAISSDKALTDADGVKNLLTAAYEGIKGTYGSNEGGEMYGGTFNQFAELFPLDGDATFIGTFSDMQDLEAKALTVYDGNTRLTWIRAYDVINIVNQVLDHLDLLDAEDVDMVKGEALGIRGCLYFEMARLWGLQYEHGVVNSQLGVPIVLTPTYLSDDAKPVARATVEANYQQAIQDLTDAKTLLEPLDKNSDRFSTYAASAMLSRIYLQQGEYEKAAEEANRVIGSGLFTLAGKPLDAYNKNFILDEYVFTIKQTSTSNAGESNQGIATFYASLYGAGRGEIVILDQHLAKYEAGDLRGGLVEDLSTTATINDVKKMFYVGVGAHAGYVNTSKWGDPRLNIPVVRLAEMYLTRAEGNFESGAAQVGPNTPLDDINVIRHRAGLTDLGSVDRAAIHKERELELCWEGFRLHDLRRWKENIAGFSYNAPNLLLPIPQREMDVNDLLEQNPGY